MSEDKDSQNQVMTIKEVSLYLRIPVWTVYELTRAGKINGKKFGKHWRFLRADIVDYFHGSTFFPAMPNPVREQRRDPRINVTMRAEVVSSLTEEKSIPGIIRNLSAGGVYFMPDEPEKGEPSVLPARFESGDLIRVVFELPKGRIKGHGRIVHRAAAENQGYGIKFRDLQDAEKEAIENYVG